MRSFTIFFSLILVVLLTTGAAAADAHPPSDDTRLSAQMPPAFVGSLLTPSVAKAVRQYYGPHSGVRFNHVKIVHIQSLAPGNFSHFRYTVKLDVYFGRHYPAFAMDTITFEHYRNTVKVIDYKHRRHSAAL